uniref:Uncharacterized protein n=1 Tax=Gloeochaete wittrockiana TaxID=38269 RepID=A0A3G1IVV7_9EUKA|nr:hypothetical protein [Gloeochaete wittrockiana]ASQ40188.1 hypothetical protein [Gloeochaete wittrockiana]
MLLTYIDGAITFNCFNNFSKIHLGVLCYNKLLEEKTMKNLFSEDLPPFFINFFNWLIGGFK